ncbi:MAG: hypothetical protein ACREFT_17650 [Acetobacteraceae bacterium]
MTAQIEAIAQQTHGAVHVLEQRLLSVVPFARRAAQCAVRVWPARTTAAKAQRRM